MSKSGLWAIAAVAIVTLLGLVYLALSWEAPQGTTTVVLPAPANEPEPEPDASGPASNLPRIRIQPETPPPAQANTEVEVAPAPVEVTETEPEPEPERSSEPAVQLPSLSNSDSFVLDALRGLQNGAALVRLVSDEQLIRSFVVLVDNVSRNSFPQTNLPYRGMSEEMPVRTLDDNLYVMDQAAHGRFDDIIDTFVSVDTGAAMALYRSMSPLFQRAYAELGYGGDAQFDAALQQAIGNVLRMELPEGPYQLVKPSVMYLYADAEIENLPAVHKQLIRLGPENTARLKNKLRQFADRL